MKKLILLILVSLLIFIGIISFKTITAPHLQIKIKHNPAPVLSDNALQHFQEAISFPTISYNDTLQWKAEPFIQFRQFLEKTY
ncbi:MAG TPA: hypothetical protein PK332_12345, partial [Chitinophagales bacterium]|nr:hypothetical protein [Chitinophagales bacterium]